MNIFVVSENPSEAAKDLCDKHVNKMILESAQLLSTAHRVLDGSLTNTKPKRWILDDDRETILYKSTHTNHPCSVWVRQSKQNYTWLYDHFTSLLFEYSKRYKKVHACSKLILPLLQTPNNIKDLGLTNFVQAMPEEYKHENAIVAYRTYYIKEKSKIAKWNFTEVPAWF